MEHHCCGKAKMMKDGTLFRSVVHTFIPCICASNLFLLSLSCATFLSDLPSLYSVISPFCSDGSSSKPIETVVDFVMLITLSLLSSCRVIEDNCWSPERRIQEMDATGVLVAEAKKFA